MLGFDFFVCNWEKRQTRTKIEVYAAQQGLTFLAQVIQTL
jgi:hypothetical protein